MPPKKQSSTQSVKQSRSNITFEPAKRTFYNRVIKILTQLTKIPWGHVRSQYITSAEYPVKIGTSWGNYHERFRKYKLDINILSRDAADFATADIWDAAIAAELQFGLLAKIPNDSITYKYVAEYKPTGEFADLLWTADEFLKLHGRKTVTEHDIWMKDCTRVI